MIKLLSPLISNFLFMNLNPFSRCPSPNYRRFAAYLLAFFFLVSSYILGCVALYSYLVLHCGEPLSLFILCIFLLLTSLSLMGIGWFLKPKHPPSTDLASTIEKTVNHLSMDQVFSKALPTLLPISLVGLLAIVAAASYITYSKKNKD